jgi:hypothetical protein
VRYSLLFTIYWGAIVEGLLGRRKCIEAGAGQLTESSKSTGKQTEKNRHVSNAT